MKRLGIITLLVFTWVSVTYGVSWLTINGQSQRHIDTPEATIVLSCDVDSFGNKISCEIYRDFNQNALIDSDDERLYFQYVVDGLGPIQDPEFGETIPGDESVRDGIIQTTLVYDEATHPNSSQQWLIRVRDQDNSSAVATLRWHIPRGPSGIEGQVTDSRTGVGIEHAIVHVLPANMPEHKSVATTDPHGRFSINLPPGEYTVETAFPTNHRYKSSTLTHKVGRGTFQMLDIQAEPFTTFVRGIILFENHAPAENVAVLLQNQEDFSIYHAKSDEQGNYNIGVPAGTYSITVSEYVAAYLDHHYWPDGFYAQPESDVLSLQAGQRLNHDIDLVPYPAFIEGTCTLNGEPVPDALIQGVAIDPETHHQKIFQTFSREDGSYSLGVSQQMITSVIAQKHGTSLTSFERLKHIDMTEKTQMSNMNFTFVKQVSLMGLSGQVTDKHQHPLAGVYVVAYNAWDHTPNGHLITQTDARGTFSFDVHVEGDWLIGVHKQDYHAHPHLYYKYLSNGMHYNQLNFVLSDDHTIPVDYDAQLQLADFQLLPHLPDPIYKETFINFVLPKSSYTEVEVLNMEGEELATLIEDQLSKGYQKIRWDGKDQDGNLIANGVYLCRVTSQDYSTIQPITLLK